MRYPLKECNPYYWTTVVLEKVEFIILYENIMKSSYDREAASFDCNVRKEPIVFPAAQILQIPLLNSRKTARSPRSRGKRFAGQGINQRKAYGGCRANTFAHPHSSIQESLPHALQDKCIVASER